MSERVNASEKDILWDMKILRMYGVFSVSRLECLDRSEILSTLLSEVA